MILRSTRLGALALAIPLAAACSSGDHGSTDSAVSGELEVLIANSGPTSTRSYFLNAASGDRYELLFERAPSDQLSTGDQLRVYGSVEQSAQSASQLRVEQFDVVSGGNPLGSRQHELVNQPVKRNSKVAILLVNWTAPSSLTAATARGQMFTDATSVRAHFLETSYGQQDLSGDVFGWYTIAAPNGCDYNAIRTSAEAAARAAGVALDTYNHVGIYWPRMSACSWSGLGQLGSPTRPARYTWYNGSGKSVFTHELGHNFGLFHSRSLNCGAASIAPKASCSFVEYGDSFDPMGRGGMRHFNANNKLVLGWFGGCNGVTAPAGGTFQIVPIETASNGVQLLRIPMNSALCPPADSPGMTSCEYEIEYRQPVGFDAPSTNGVLVYATSRTTRTNPSLLDMTPSTAGNVSDAMLKVGSTFTDPDGIKITVVSATATAATVQVQVPNGTGNATCLDGTTYGSTPGPTCTDGVKNGTETAVDCGGTTCPKCSNGAACLVGGDCASTICSAGVCAAPSCADGIKNGSETAVDCGGTTCAKCANGAACLVGGDCVSTICTAGVCAASSCSDGLKNGSETAVDCGGPTCSKCANGAACLVASDCQSALCSGGVCAAQPPEPTCTDGAKNGSETGVDCGGASCPKCANGVACLVGSDCSSNTCTGGLCVPAPVGGGLSGTVTIRDQWATGYCADVVVSNTGTTSVSTWTASIDLNQGQLSGSWNVNATQSGEVLTGTPVSWNAAIPARGSVAWGYCANKLGTSWQPTFTSVR